jgi:hypothetical protein
MDLSEIDKAPAHPPKPIRELLGPPPNFHEGRPADFPVSIFRAPGPALRHGRGLFADAWLDMEREIDRFPSQLPSTPRRA